MIIFEEPHGLLDYLFEEKMQHTVTHSLIFWGNNKKENNECERDLGS